MSGRTTTEIVEILRARHRIEGFPVDREAADRLAELQSKRDLFEAQSKARASIIAMLDALRLPCPTCGGNPNYIERVNAGHGNVNEMPCPDCTDGRMSHERAWKIVAAVFDEAREQRVDDLLANLRGVR